ncbi:hypothetical protein BN946_scf184970.g48 [Trametes cinnabarina]|uniref:Uncharacterized protein n=1 Tax=Pycnoporus cinnabarinus TaxID=5643 RepID=A0A060SD85_PYCCI|nr:hypothetical protein BN946_scf184970.g48 [Trametes cinnabarina]
MAEHSQGSPQTRLCHTFPRPLHILTSRHEDRNSSEPGAGGQSPPNLRERRALRTLYLTTTAPPKRYPAGAATENRALPTRKRMAGLFHLEPHTPPTSPTSPSLTSLSLKSGRSRRLYQRLDDSLYAEWSNEEVYRTERPSPALVSPWSPSEYEFPSPSLHSPSTATSSEPATPPPIYPPPPAYDPEVPQRSHRSAPVSPAAARSRQTRIESESEWLRPPLSPIITTLDEEISREIREWTEPEQTNGSFIISNGSEDEMSETDSLALGSAESGERQ